MLERLRRIKHVALDMDGTIYNGNHLFPYTKKFLDDLDRMDITYSFLTNNSSRSTKDYILHLHDMTLDITEDKIYTSAHATIAYLKFNHPNIKKVFILGTPGMIKEFEQAGFISVADSADEEPDAVIVGYDTTLNYARLTRAAWWIFKGKLYLATNPDLICPTNQPLVLVDCGSMCAALEKSTGRKPDVVPGKPSPEMLAGIRGENNLEPDQIAMVGDRIYTDMLMANKANAVGVLVLSGEATKEDAKNANFTIDVVTESLESLGSLLLKAHSLS